MKDLTDSRGSWRKDRGILGKIPNKRKGIPGGFRGRGLDKGEGARPPYLAGVEVFILKGDASPAKYSPNNRQPDGEGQQPTRDGPTRPRADLAHDPNAEA